MTPSNRNPYSADRYADPAVFQGYREAAGNRPPGGWTLEEMARCLVKPVEGAPSYWIVGDRKLGKTSFLIKLQNLLPTFAQRPGAHRIPFPVYVCCREYDSLADFYRGVLRRAAEILHVAQTEARSAPDVTALELFSDDGSTLPDLELVDLLRQDLFALFAERLPPRFRIVLLIDHVEVALEHGWAAPLFAHLRALLTDTSRDAGLGRETLSVAIAGCRSIVEPRDPAGLLDLLEEVPLRALAENEVWTLVSQPSPIPLELEWSKRIHEATAGHPWLVQFIMETFVRLIQVPADLEEHFDSMITTRFQREPERVAILREWLDSLRPDGIRVLAHLALDNPLGSTAELSAATGLTVRSVEKHLQRMVDLGITFKPRFQKGERYVLGAMFRHWFLAHTGGQVFLGEIESLRKCVAAREERSEKRRRPFSLMVTLNPDVIFADAHYARFSKAGNELSESLDEIEYRVRTLKGQKDLFFLAAKTLRSAIRQADWEELWNDYSKASDHPVPFVLRLEDPKLLEFPVELLRVDGTFLGLKAPVYKELIGIKKASPYMLADQPLLPDSPLNVLLVASNAGGKMENQLYPELGSVQDELVDILGVLQEGADKGTWKIGKIVALTNQSEGLPSEVKQYPASAANLKRALQGELQIDFHLFHYGGHYVCKEGERPGGFLVSGDRGPELFNLSRLAGALDRTKLRLVILNGCQSGQHDVAPAEYHIGAAHTILQRGVPVVIGMRHAITDGEALLFSQRFYRALAECGTPEEALWKARYDLHASQANDSLLWATPVMLTC